ncbi:hypothetical protein G7054_g14653 [Neopestalotiopsis clavispora]|nr:hypothetical protein G7054_g14653 [Neopestalotiopsis clavispora]
MKFGRNFARHQVPRWADFYVDYDEWKVLVKAGKLQAAELRKALARNTREVETFLQDKFEVVAKQFSVLDDEYGLAIDCYDTVALCSIPNYEKKDISRSLTEIASLLILLSRYISVTQAAADRISTKTARILDEIECLKSILQNAAVQWAQSLRGINSLLRTLHVARPDAERGTSSLLTRHETARCSGQLDNAVRALQLDSISQLEECLCDGSAEKSDYCSQTTLLILSKIGILCSASNCLPFLLSRFSTGNDPGQNGLLNPLRLQILHDSQLKDEYHSHQSVRSVLDSLLPVHWPVVLLSPDSLGRVALHYAAFHGMTTACNEMIQCILSLDLSKAAENIPIFLLKDNLGETPLSIAIAQGHGEVLKSFLNWLHPSGAQAFIYGTSKLEGVFHGMASLAIRSQRPQMTELLIDHDPRLVATCSKASELLYLASQFGHTSIVERLLKHTNNINIGERLRGRTPLMIAAIYEHTDVVKLLLSHPSCDVSVRDRDGWTAVTHAAFKGTTSLVDLLQDHGGGLGTRPTLAKPQSSIKLPANRLDRQNRGSGVARDYSHVFINLGHFDMEKESVILQIEAFRRLVAPMHVPESSLTIEVSAIDSSVPEKYQLALPILEDLSNDPLVFSAKNPRSVKLMFRVYCSVLPHKAHEPSAQLIGSALVSLGDAHKRLGPSLESLERDHTVSLISPDAFGNEYIGGLTFTFVISNPFVFKGSPPTPTSMVLKRNASPPLVAGHRDQARLQLGENTMDSFFAALNLGADILELMVASIMQDSTARPPGTASSLMRKADLQQVQRPRAYSHGRARPDNIDIVARLMSTFNFQNFGFKGNIGGECIHGPFIKLEQLLVEIDSSVCFDIELKYPMLFEARDFDMDTIAMELNLYLDMILDIVFRHGKNRPIFFSSFSPELCFVLSNKQQIYPILFLTESGYIPTRDIRATSFQEAVRFAKKWNLEGVAIRSQPLVAAPELIDLVKSSGLVCASWGDLNDEPESVKSLSFTFLHWLPFMAKKPICLFLYKVRTTDFFFAQLQADFHLDVIITNKVGEVVLALERPKN